MGQSSSLTSKRIANALQRGNYPLESTSNKHINNAILQQSLQLLTSLSTSNNNNNNNIPQLFRKKSNIAIGDGIFAESTITPGTLVAFFPGRTHLGLPNDRDDENPRSLHPKQTWKQNDKTMSLPDGGRVDGEAYVNDFQELKIENKYAVGHLINHPNPSDFPNVLAWPIMLDTHKCEQDHAIPKNRIPCVLDKTWYWSDTMNISVPVPQDMLRKVPCIGIVATRHIYKGDELLLDYNLNSTEKWYTARDPEMDYENECQDQDIDVQLINTNQTKTKTKTTTSKYQVYENPEMYEFAFGDRNFKQEVDFLHQVYNASNSASNSTDHQTGGFYKYLEIGCGPAWHSIEHVKRNKKMNCAQNVAYSIDVSQAMVDYAKKKASESNVSNQVHVIVGDMRSLNTNKNLTETDFECTSILLGTIGHILTHEDCISTLTSIYNLTKPSGVLIVEFENAENFHKNNELGVWDVEKDQTCVEVTWGEKGDAFNAETQIINRTVKMLQINVDGQVMEEIQEKVASKIWTANEFLTLAKETKWESIGVFGDMDMKVSLNDEDAHNMVLAFRKE